MASATHGCSQSAHTRSISSESLVSEQLPWGDRVLKAEFLPVVYLFCCPLRVTNWMQTPYPRPAALNFTMSTLYVNKVSHLLILLLRFSTLLWGEIVQPAIPLIRAKSSFLEHSDKITPGNFQGVASSENFLRTTLLSRADNKV